MSSKSPLVSVIVPAYNAAPWVRETLDSALNQTHDNIEILLIDDGSTDDTVRIAKEYSDNRLTVIERAHEGGCRARNAGLAAAKGDFIQYLDADDLLSPDKIARQVDLLGRSPRGCLAVCGVVYFFDGEPPESGDESPGYPGLNSDAPVEWLTDLWSPGPGYGTTKWGMVPPQAWLTPREVADRAGPWNESLIRDQDGEYFCRAVLAGEGVRWEPGSRVFYRKFRHRMSVSGQTSPRALESNLRAVASKAAALDRTIGGEWPEATRRAIARQFMDVSVSAFPTSPTISKEAEGAACRYGGYDPSPFFRYNRVLWLVSRLFGWRTAAKLRGAMRR